ncbi:MAG: hypothetical protein QOD83_3525 [Solirubrobacteraceae bacterium]|jgi:hypothetical protein|nr:hypothetical protein [Solirubrobacteraceae bacterium]
MGSPDVNPYTTAGKGVAAGPATRRLAACVTP